MKNILIIGGMGPQASLSLHQRIITKASQLGARRCQDYPAIMHLSLPVPDDGITSPEGLTLARGAIIKPLARLWRLQI
jgi:aspartate/glutamate racemase